MNWTAKDLAKTPVGRKALFGDKWDKPNQPKPEKIIIGEVVKLTFTIAGTLTGLNEYVEACRAKAAWANSIKKKEEERVTNALLANGFKEFQKVDIHYHWVEKNRKRDKDNIRFAAKFINDAITGLVIPNDGWKNVGSLSDSYDVDKENPRVEVTISGVLQP